MVRSIEWAHADWRASTNISFPSAMFSASASASASANLDQVKACYFYAILPIPCLLKRWSKPKRIGPAAWRNDEATNQLAFLFALNSLQQLMRLFFYNKTNWDIHRKTSFFKEETVMKCRQASTATQVITKPYVRNHDLRKLNNNVS